MAEQSYGTWLDWLLCLAAIIFMQTPSWHRSRYWKRHPERKALPQPAMTATPPSQTDPKQAYVVPMFVLIATIVGFVTSHFERHVPIFSQSRSECDWSACRDS